MTLQKEYSLKAFYISQGSYNLFALLYEPQKSLNEAILIVPPFADEMNKCRRMISLQSRRFCELGYSVLLIDLYGTGDSFGDFGDASWEIWRDNIKCSWKWLQQEFSFNSIHFWGVRLGCLLAVDTASFFQLPVSTFLFWQPVTSGQRYMTQLLRTRIAEQWNNTNREKIEGLRENIFCGEALEIAGYMLNSKLFLAIDNLSLNNLIPNPKSNVIWLECLLGSLEEILPASCKTIELWRQKGINIQTCALSGPPFWNSVEIEEVDALIDQSILMFLRKRNHAGK